MAENRRFCLASRLALAQLGSDASWRLQPGAIALQRFASLVAVASVALPIACGAAGLRRGWSAVASPGARLVPGQSEPPCGALLAWQANADPGIAWGAVSAGHVGAGIAARPRMVRHYHGIGISRLSCIYPL